jgi:hypothetical protein
MSRKKVNYFSYGILAGIVVLVLLAISMACNHNN